MNMVLNLFFHKPNKKTILILISRGYVSIWVGILVYFLDEDIKKHLKRSGKQDLEDMFCILS